MPYQAEISRDNPTCFLFVIDQSGSMDEITETGRSKADFVADVLNKTLYTLITTCSKADGVRNYFDVGVIAYAGSQVTSGFGGALSGDIVHPIQAISENTLRVEERKRKVDDGAGGIVELKTGKAGAPVELPSLPWAVVHQRDQDKVEQRRVENQDEVIRIPPTVKEVRRR